MSLEQKREFFDSAADGWPRQLPAEEETHLRRFLALIRTHLQPGDRILDIGCGIGLLAGYLSEFTVTGIDLSFKMLSTAQQHNHSDGVSYAQADAHELPFGDQQFAAALLLSVLPHIDQPERALKEIHRVLQSGGLLAIIHLEDRETINQIHTSIGGAIGNDLLPEPNDLLQMIEECGFQNLRVEMNAGFFMMAKKV